MKPAVNLRVEVAKPLAIGGGTSPWLGRKGVIKKLLSGNAVLVKLDDDQGHSPLMFFVRELVILDES